jgi:hypothetical protein
MHDACRVLTRSLLVFWLPILRCDSEAHKARSVSMLRGVPADRDPPALAWLKLLIELLLFHFSITDHAANAASFWSRPHGAAAILPTLDGSSDEGETMRIGTGHASRKTSR